jgi:SAM-dependent methyltransferase
VAGSFAVSRCAGCELGVLHPPPDDATLAAAYGDDYGPHGAPAPHAQAGPSRRIPAGRPGRALVIGAGGGANLSRLIAAGWTAQGVEPDTAAVARACAAGLDVRAGTAEAGPFPDGPFDLVWLPAVLEHVRDPIAALRNAGRQCAPGGRVVVWTQNPGSRSATRWGGDWVHLDPPRHLWHFSEAALRAAATRAGLRLQRLRSRSRPRGRLASAEIRAARAGHPRDLRRSRWRKALLRPACWLDGWLGRGDLWDAEFVPHP